MKSRFKIISLLCIGALTLWAESFAEREERCLKTWLAGEVEAITIGDQRTIKPAFFVEFMQEVLLTGSKDDFIRIWHSPLGSELRRNVMCFVDDPAVPDAEKQRVLEYIWEMFQEFQPQDNWTSAQKAEDLQIFLFLTVFETPVSVSDFLHEQIIEEVVAGKLTPFFIVLDEFVRDERLLNFLKRAPEPARDEVLTSDSLPRFIFLALKARFGDQSALTRLLEAWRNMDPQQPMCNRVFPQLLALTGQDEAIQLLFDVVEGEDIEAQAPHQLFPDSLHINAVLSLGLIIEGFPAKLIILGYPGIQFSITPYREWCNASNRKNYRLHAKRISIELVERSIMSLNPQRTKKNK